MNGKDYQVEQEAVTREDLLPELQSVFENIAKKEGYINYEITTTKVSSGGANFSGVLYEVDIKGNTEDGEKETNLFLKKVVIDGFVGDMIGVANVYVTEKYVYEDLAMRLHKLQSEANIPEEERYKTVKYFENSDLTTIILENMAKKAFGTPHRMEVVPVKYAELCMEQLAKFHALSFALKIKDPDYFETKVSHYRNPINADENAILLADMAMKITVRDLDPINKAKAEKVIAAFSEKFRKYLSPESSSITCLCHGDFRASNILMRQNEGEVAEVVPVDYQCIHIGCPVSDILSFIGLGTDRKFRVQHLENLKTLYYDTLTKFLKYFDIDSNDVYPRKEMDEIFSQRMDYISFIAVFGFTFLFAPENALDTKYFSLDERYKERLIEILEDFPVQ